MSIAKNDKDGADRSIPIALVSFWALPTGQAEPEAKAQDETQRWKRLDLPGVLAMLTAVLLLIVALTLGATYGWATAYFIAPLVVSVIALPVFVWWERSIDDDKALLPSALFRVPNFGLFLVFSLVILGWWASNFMAFIQMFQIQGDSIILAAVRTLPEGAAAMSISIIMM